MNALRYPDAADAGGKSSSQSLLSETRSRSPRLRIAEESVQVADCPIWWPFHQVAMARHQTQVRHAANSARRRWSRRAPRVAGLTAAASPPRDDPENPRNPSLLQDRWTNPHRLSGHAGDQLGRCASRREMYLGCGSRGAAFQASAPPSSGLDGASLTMGSVHRAASSRTSSGCGILVGRSLAAPPRRVGRGALHSAN